MMPSLELRDGQRRPRPLTKTSLESFDGHRARRLHSQPSASWTTLRSEADLLVIQLQRARFRLRANRVRRACGRRLSKSGQWVHGFPAGSAVVPSDRRGSCFVRLNQNVDVIALVRGPPVAGLVFVIEQQDQMPSCCRSSESLCHRSLRKSSDCRPFLQDPQCRARERRCIRLR